MNTDQYKATVSCFVCQMVYGSIAFGLPRMLVAIMEEFRSTRAETGTIVAVNAGVNYCTGVVSGSLVYRFGAKTICIVGALLLSSAFCVSYFATSIVYLIITLGVFSGLGLAFIFVSTIQAISDVFEGRLRVTAVSLTTVGCSVGGMTYSYLVEVLLKTYDVRGTFLIIGCVSLNAMAMAMLWKPKVKENVINIQEINQHAVSVSANTSDKDTRNRHTLLESFKQILSNTAFVLFSMANAIDITVQSITTFYISDTLRDKDDSNDSRSSLTFFLVTLLSLFGRPLFGLCHRISHSAIFYLPTLSIIQSITGCLLIAFADSLTSMKVVGWCLIGLSIGITVSSLTGTTAALLEPRDIATGSGLILTTTGILTTIGGPLNGLMRDITGTYHGMFLFNAGLLFLAGLFLISAKIIHSRTSIPTATNVQI